MFTLNLFTKSGTESSHAAGLPSRSRIGGTGMYLDKRVSRSGVAFHGFSPIFKKEKAIEQYNSIVFYYFKNLAQGFSLLHFYSEERNVLIVVKDLPLFARSCRQFVVSDLFA